MAITGKFVSDFSDFNRGVTEASGKLLAFEGNAAKAGTSIKAIESTARTTTPVLGSMAAQLAGMFTVGAVVAFGRSVFQAADSIQKMADQTGLSTTEVQKLMYVAGQSGTSIQSLVGAVQNLQQRLGDNNSGAAGAMAKLGINAEAFNRLGTYQQMTTLADAVRGITDPTEQASVAAALFGKTWKEILPAIKSGMKEVGDAATTMSDASVKAADRAGDALTRLQGTTIAWGGTAVLWLEKASMALGDYLTLFSPSHFGQTNTQILAQQEAMAKAESATARWASGAMAGVPPARNLGAAAKDMGMSFEDAAGWAKNLDIQIGASIKTNTIAAPVVDRLAEAYQKLMSEVNNEAGMAQFEAGAESLKRAAQNAEALWQMEHDAWKQSQAELSAATAAADAFSQALMDTALAGDAANAAIAALPAVADPASASVEGMGQAAQQAASGFFSMSEGLYSAIRAAQAADKQKGGSNSWWWNPITGHELTRAAGGPVSAGQTYMVGEQGPELFSPSTSGSIIPNGVGGGVTVIVQGSVLSTRAELARLVKDAIAGTHMAGGGRMPA